jgi:hypothetical protein
MAKYQPGDLAPRVSLNSVVSVSKLAGIVDTRELEGMKSLLKTQLN